MSIRSRIIDYSRGNDLHFFWCLYRWQKKRKDGLWHDILTFMLSRCAHRHGGYIGPDTVIKGGLILPHGLHGVFISRYARIGENCRIYQNVTIGEVNRKAPVIGDNCLIGAGAVIIGDIRIGNDVKIGAGAVVNTDIPDQCTAVSPAVRKIPEIQHALSGIARPQSRGMGTERAWIEISGKNLRHNVKVLKEIMPPQSELMAVVKAQAYGHGAVWTAMELNKVGVRAFAVAAIGEGIELRKGGVCGEILILGYTDVGRAWELKAYDLTQTLISLEYAEALNDQGVAVKTHIKIDTGMHRLGISDDEVDSVRKVFFMKNLEIYGMFTHLCCSDSRKPEDIAFTEDQIGRFYKLVDALRNSGIRLPKLHIQSSYGLLNYPDLVCDYVRVGIALYGVLSSPHDDTVRKPDLRPVLSLKSRVVLIRQVKKGEGVGYGRSFIAKRDSRIAILPIGYGDGIPRHLSDGKGMVLIRRHLVPVIGKICMDQLAVDITDMEDVSVGDIATLAGEEGYGELAVPVIADRCGSISNELLCGIGAGLPVVPK